MLFRAGGAVPRDVVKVTVFLKYLDDMSAFNRIYKRFFNRDPPARSLVAVKSLALGGLVEIEAIAVVH
jgi:2-iminobutanoate/2-iminopropanoate deaminase